MIGGIHRPSDGTALSSRNASTMGAAMAKSAPSARTRSTPNRRKTPATIAMTIGMGMTLITRRTQPVRPRTRMSTPVANEGADDLGPGEMPESRTDQHRSRNRPEHCQRLAVEPAGQDGQQAVEEEDPEDPRRQLRWGQTALGADRQDHRNGTGGREDHTDQAVRGVERSEVAAQPAPSGSRLGGALDQWMLLRTSHVHLDLTTGQSDYHAASPWSRLTVGRPLSLRAGQLPSVLRLVRSVPVDRQVCPGSSSLRLTPTMTGTT